MYILHVCILLWTKIQLNKYFNSCTDTTCFAGSCPIQWNTTLTHHCTFLNRYPDSSHGLLPSLNYRLHNILTTNDLWSFWCVLQTEIYKFPELFIGRIFWCCGYRFCSVDLKDKVFLLFVQFSFTFILWFEVPFYNYLL